MYVIYPADELLRIYENPAVASDPSPVLTVERRPSCEIHVIAVSEKRTEEPRLDGDHREKKKKERRSNSVRGSWSRKKSAKRGETRGRGKTKDNRPRNDTRTMQNSRGAGEDAAASNPFKDLTQPGLNEPLKQHNAAALKLVQTGESLDLLSALAPMVFIAACRVRESCESDQTVVGGLFVTCLVEV